MNERMGFSVEIRSKESLPISNIIRKIHLESAYEYLEAAQLESYLENVTHLTCRFIQCAMAEEEVNII